MKNENKPQRGPLPMRLDAARIMALRRAIGAGRFRVDASIVADRMLAGTMPHVTPLRR